MSGHKPKVLFFGAFKSAALDGTIGGQAYACRSLVESPLSEKVEWILIDTTQRSQPPPAMIVRLFFAACRTLKIIWFLLTKRVESTLIFTSYDVASFLEKGTVAIVSRILGKRTVMSIRAEIKRTHHENYTDFFRKWSIGCCHQVICQSDEAVSQLTTRLKIPRDKLTIVPNWIDTENYKIQRTWDGKQPVRFLYLGYLETFKGIQHLVDAAAEVKNSNYDFTIEIGGGGGETEALKKQSCELGVDDRISFLGWVSGEKKTRAFKEADVLVLPSYSEGMPNSILEAMSSGLAIIATPVGGIPYLIPSEKHGILVKARESNELAAAMKRLIDNRQLISAMGKANEKRALENHDVNKVWPKVAEVLDIDITAKFSTSTDPDS